MKKAIIGICISYALFAGPIYLECSTKADRLINNESTAREFTFDLAVNEETKNVVFTPTSRSKQENYQATAIFSSSSIMFNIFEMPGMKETFSLDRATLGINISTATRAGNETFHGSSFNGECKIKNVKNKI